jgi:hypothetical protein
VARFLEFAANDTGMTKPISTFQNKSLVVPGPVLTKELGAAHGPGKEPIALPLVEATISQQERYHGKEIKTE